MKLIGKVMAFLLAAVCLLGCIPLGLTASAEEAWSFAPIKTAGGSLFLDTDIGADSDDAAAMALMLTLKKKYGFSIAGIVNSTSCVYGNGAIDAILTYYGEEIDKTGIYNYEKFRDTDDGYNRYLTENMTSHRSDMVPSTEYYHDVFEAQPDNSITLVTIGSFKAVAAFLKEYPDLFNRKVRAVVCMGGNFEPGIRGTWPYFGKNVEYNVYIDPESAAYFAENCEKDIVWSPWELTADRVIAGFDTMDWNNPVTVAFYMIGKGQMQRSCCDPSAVQFAIEGDTGLYTYSKAGKVTVDAATGVSAFTETAGGPHRVIRENISVSATTAYLQSLIRAGCGSRIPLATPGVARLYRDVDHHGQYTALEQRSYTAEELAQYGLTMAQIRSVSLTDGLGLAFYENEDLTGRLAVYWAADTPVSPELASRFGSCAFIERQNVAPMAYIDADDGSDADRLIDERPGCWETELDGGPMHVYLDLGEPMDVYGYSLRLAESVGWLGMYNVRDLAVYYSLNGKSGWRLADRVTGNTDAELKRPLSLSPARFWCLEIVTPNASVLAEERNMVAISEWEVYAVPDEKPYPAATTLYCDHGTWICVADGEIAADYTGLFNYGGTYYYVRDGLVDFNTETLVNYGGSWWHVKGGKVVFDTTLVNYGGNWYYVGGGKVDFGATGLFNYGGTYYFVNKGQVDFKTETLVSYGGSWWHVKGGKVVFDTTLVNYAGGWYYVGGGKVDFGAAGLFNYGGSWWHVKGGKVVFDTTLVNYSGGWWYVKDGKVSFETTLAKYGSTWYYVQGGKVNFSANGKCVYYGKTYTVKNGVVQ